MQSLYVMFHLTAESLFVIPLRRLMCCMVTGPDHGTWVLGPLVHAPPSPPMSSLRVGASCQVTEWTCPQRSWPTHTVGMLQVLLTSVLDKRISSSVNTTFTNCNHNLEFSKV